MKMKQQDRVELRIELVKRLSALMREKKDLDYKFSVWARDARNTFSAGDAGEREFSTWCQVDAGLDAVQTGEMLLRAAVIDAIPNAKKLADLGGSKRISVLAPLPRDEQRKVVQTAIVEQKTIGTVMRERGHAPEVRRSPPAKSDAETIAEWVRDNPRGIPKAIVEAAKRLVGEPRKLRSVA